MDWTKIVTHPLGLAAFALALIFGVAGVKLQDRQRPWFLPAAIIIAVIVMICCFFLANRQIVAEKELAQPQTSTSESPQNSHNRPSSTSHEPAEAQHPASATVHQETHGSGSPAIQGVQGDVTINVDQGGRHK